MENSLHPITRDRHVGKQWSRPKGFDFAAKTNLVPIAGAELGEVAKSFPLAFVANEGKQILVALLGFMPGENLFVAPDGRWLAPYVPAALRAYPFRLAQQSGQPDNFALMVDEASGLVTDIGVQAGTPFFGEDGNAHPQTAEVMDFLVKTKRSGDALNRVVEAIEQHGLIEPWPLVLKDGNNQRNVAGLGRINEKALNALPDDAFLALRHAGALPVAYAQLISSKNTESLAKLAQARAIHRQRQAKAEAALFTPSMEDEKFDWNSLFKD